MKSKKVRGDAKKSMRYMRYVAQFGTIWLKPATLLQETFPHGCFSGFLNCTNGTKSRKASHMNKI